VLDTSQTTLDSHGMIYHTGVDPTANITLNKAIIKWVIDTQQPFDIVNNEKWKRIWKIALNIPCPINSYQTLCR
jgi:hypothetical protein